MKKTLFTFILVSFSFLASGQKLPLLKISDNHRYLVTQQNEPFFWLGGTAWELIHRLTKEEIDIYLTDRAKKGFTVIQTVILAELDGLNTPNAYGHKPLINNNPETINEEYFKLVDYVVKRAGKLGLYVGLLPTWGDKFNQAWGQGPVIFNPQNAEAYAQTLAKRYLSHTNIIWILGGDRVPETEQQAEVIRAMAKGIQKVDSIHLITYHPSGAKNAIDYFNEPWLDLDMFQSGHSRTAREYQYVFKSTKSTPSRPVINGEARYENIRDRFWEEKQHGWLDDADVRASAYWSLLSGAAGYTYGCNDIWQIYETGRPPIINARTDWNVSLHLPGSTQMGFMKNIFERFAWQSMEYSPSLILNENLEGDSFMMAAMGKNKDFIMVYTPTGKAVELDLKTLKTDQAFCYWFNPRSGKIQFIGKKATSAPAVFKPWAEGWGSDFLLIVTTKEIK